MVRLSIITRTDKSLERDTKQDLHYTQFSSDPRLHPLQPAREFQRAITAAKMNKIFAHPFVTALNTHVSGITAMAKSLGRPEIFVSGATDGEVILWDIAHKRHIARVQGFEGVTKSVGLESQGRFFVACGDDYYVKIYNGGDASLKTQFISRMIVNSIELCGDDRKIATAGEHAELWDIEKSVVIDRFSWGADTITRLKFSPVEQHLVVCTSIDRGIFVYDCRQRSLLAKVSLLNKSSTVCWNPIEPFNFVAGNEDGNGYGFDMRRLEKPSMIYKDHIGAILDLDFSPTGKYFATGSFDRTVRIFDVRTGKSTEVYHNKRMQKIFALQWTSDNKYILSGSEDANIRIWKAIKYARNGHVTHREQKAIDYREKLIKRYNRTKPIRQIMKSHLPKYIVNAKRKKQIMKESQYRKTENRRVFNEEIFEEPLPEKKRKVQKFEE